MTNLNFTYNWQNQKYIAGKKNITQIISSNSRPATNGYWDKSQLNELDANAFIPRPIKSWRKQLQPNKIRGGTKSKNIILESEQPGRIISTDNWCNNYTELREITFFGEYILTNEYPPIAMTANSLNVAGNTYGNGNYIASSSSTRDGLLPWRAFDDTTTQWRSANKYNVGVEPLGLPSSPASSTTATTGPILGEWIQLQLPDAIKLKLFVIKVRALTSVQPKKMKLLGSNNPNNDWNILYETDDLRYLSYVETIYVNATELYSYYRLVILSLDGGSQPYVDIVEIQFFEEIILIKEYPPIAMTQDITIVSGNTYGNGNYIASASSNGTGFSSWHTFDDTDNSWRSGSVYPNPTTSTITNTGPILGEWIQLQLPMEIKLKSFLITPNINFTPIPVKVKLLGSNNPANTWNILYETNLLEYNTTIYVNDIISYSYYRLVILTTNSNNILITQIVSNISSDKYNNFNTDIANTITYDNIVNCQNGPVGKYICCNPEKNIIKYNQITPINNNFIDTSSYLQSKCNIYTQSYTKSSNIDYFNIYGLALFPNDNTIGGPQLLINSKCYKTCGTNCPSILNKPYNQNLIEKYSIYKPNNREYSIQGAVSSSSRISNLKNNTIAKYNSNANSAYGLQNANYTNIIKDKTCCNIDTNKVIMFTFIYSFYSTDTIENIIPAIPFITSGNLKIYIMNIYEEIPSIFTIKIQGTYINNNNTFIDGFSLSNTNGYYTYGIDDPSINILSPNIFTIIQFGGAPLSRAGKQFENLHHTKLTITATDVPTILSNTSLESCFSKCFNFNVNINFFDTASVTDMSNMFNDAILFNNGDTGNNGNNPLSFTTSSLLTNISGMFQGAANFNQVLTFTNTSSVTDMSYMFYNSKYFTNGVTPSELNFITNKVINMDYMFAGIDSSNITQFNANFRVNGIYWGNNSNPSYTNFNQYGSITDIYLPIWMTKNW